MQTSIPSFFGREAPPPPESREHVVEILSSDDDAPLVSVDLHVLQQQVDRVENPAVRAQHQRAKRDVSDHGRYPGNLVARDGAAVVVAPSSECNVCQSRQLYRLEGEAEESCDEDVEEESGSDDSFVVPDHCSGSSMSSSDDMPAQLHDICASLRNRRNCVQCPQCLRLMRAIANFLKEINGAVHSGNRTR
jgi:hypothetical protein